MNTVFVCLFFTFCTIRFCNTKFCKTTLVSFVCNIHKIELRMKARRSSLSLSFFFSRISLVLTFLACLFLESCCIKTARVALEQQFSGFAALN